MPEPIANLICQRVMDSDNIVPGSIFTEKCDRCQELVCTAPSGQRLLAKLGRDKVEVICQVCYGIAAVAMILGLEEPPGEIGLAGTVRDILEEMRASRRIKKGN